MPAAMLVLCSAAIADDLGSCGVSIPSKRYGFEAQPVRAEDLGPCARFYHYNGSPHHAHRRPWVSSISVLRGDIVETIRQVPSNFMSKPGGGVEFRMPEPAEHAATGYSSYPISVLHSISTIKEGAGYMVVEYDRRVSTIKTISPSEAVETEERERCTSAIRSNGSTTLLMTGCIPASAGRMGFNAVKGLIESSLFQ
ncbi:hypothetical protein [Cupriavidus gilardii]|uniref:hypothetical protein n=1 Tax=Cupriavidus gilardii TaxID=82541 RepID=UPI0012E81F16|nr:hypothetical protein [Cupriavidus gilardii]